MSRFSQISIFCLLVVCVLVIVAYLKNDEFNLNDQKQIRKNKVPTSRKLTGVSSEIPGVVVSTVQQMRDRWTGLELNTPDRLEWIENFPFSPKFSTEVPFSRKKYDRSNDRFNDWDVVMRAYRHGFLKAFYQNPTRYSKPFQEIWQILEQEGLGDDPMAVALIYNDLAYYHGIMALDPEDIHDPSYPVVKPFKLEDGSVDLRVEYEAITNAEFADELYEMISGKFFYDQIWIDRERQSIEQADKIRDRIVTEVDSQPFLKKKWPVFAFNQDYEDELRDGDAMLIK